MPMYEFICQSCGRQFEELAPSVEAAAAVTCECDDHGPVQRVMSSFASTRTSNGTSIPIGGGCGRCGGPHGSCGAH